MEHAHGEGSGLGTSSIGLETGSPPPPMIRRLAKIASCKTDVFAQKWRPLADRRCGANSRSQMHGRDAPHFWADTLLMRFGYPNAALVQSRMTKKTWNLLLGIIRMRFPPGPERDIWECWALDLKTHAHRPVPDQIAAGYRKNMAAENPGLSDPSMTIH
jgi:hypothetical protein